MYVQWVIYEDWIRGGRDDLYTYQFLFIIAVDYSGTSDKGPGTQ